MKRWQRRLWVTGIGFTTSLLILVGVLIGLFRLAVQLVPDYRDEVETQVSSLLGTSALIGTMDLIWRGRYPTLQLHQVSLAEAGGDLRFEELRIGFSLWRLLQGDLMPRRIQLRGSDLQISRMDGKFQLGGLNPTSDASAEPSGFLDQLAKIGSIELLDATILWTDFDQTSPAREIRVQSLELLDGLFGAELQLKARMGEDGVLEARARLQTTPWQLEALELDLSQAAVWDELASAFPTWPKFTGAMNSLHIESRWQQGIWDQADVRFDLEDVGVVDNPQRFTRWRGALNLTAMQPGIRVELSSSELLAPSGRWPETLTTLEWQPGGDVGLNAQYLRIDDLQPWVGLAPESVRLWWSRLQPAGEIRDLIVRVSPEESWPRITASLERLHSEAFEAIPGVQGLSGTLTLDAAGGRMLLASEALVLDAPQLFDLPLPLETLSGNLSWQRSPQGWRVSAPGLHYAAMNLDGVGRLNLDLSDDPAIDLELNFFCTDPRPWLDFQPKTWGPGLRNWLSQAIQKTNVSSGQVELRGALRGFPWADKPAEGLFRVALGLEDLSLKFASDWPVLELGRAQLDLVGHELKVSAFDGQIGGLKAATATARIGTLAQGDLSVDALVTGDAADGWKMLGATNLRKTLSTVLDAVDVSGKTTLDLHLDLPLTDLSATTYEIQAGFDRAALWTRYWPDPLKKLTGEIQIAPDGLRGSDLTATVGGIPLVARLRPDNGITHIEAQLDVALAEMPASVPIGPWLRNRASGRSDWQFAMAIGPQADPVIRMESNLLGTVLNLPSPLGKAADELRHMELSVTPDAVTRISLAYAQLMNFDALVDKDAGLRAARINFGADVMPAGAPGWWVEGSLAQASMDDWLPLIADLAREGGDSKGESLRFGGLVLRVGELLGLGQRLVDTRLQMTRDAENWKLGIASARAQGTIRFPHQESAGRLKLNADFERLNWASAKGDQGPSGNPVDVPELHLTATQFSLNDVLLGQLDLDLAPVERGIRVERAQVFRDERREVDVTGLWLADEDGQSGALDFAVDTRNLSAWLKALGYEDNIDARRGQINGQVSWTPDPAGLTSRSLGGELRFDFSEGKLLNVEPGAGRVLGLFSVNALPRRFFLDFRDVVDSGLGFDSLRGSFSITQGRAETSNLELKGTSLRIAARGAVDLAQRTYDQIITVYPGLSSGVSLAATLLGGPVVGIFALLAQELLDKPLDQVTQISYQLGGSWDSPEVSRVQ